ncbi:Lipase domain containing protein [Aphelenchoides fujianensis]|nr:Lipase domain containing protein [Aphelenchoides fujianensis]
MTSRSSISLFFLLGFLCVCDATFSEGFQAFLNKEYGSKVAKQLTRLDLGVNGSFGGSMSAKPIRIFRTALVIVHGLTNTAGSMSNISEFYQGKGYGMNELYATTYGPPNTAISMTDSITCAYVKQIRQLLTAVFDYTMKPIDAVPICNQKNGLSIGSKFIDDVNSQQGYEAERIFMIRSSTDEVVGYNVNGLMVSSVPRALVNVTVSNFTHVDTRFNTLNTQYSLITSGHASELSLDKDANAESELTSSKCTGRVTGDDNEVYTGRAEDDDEGYEGVGEYDVKNKRYKFPSGWYYYHVPSQKGQFLKN